ncbi:hypothetical protein EG329_012325 [Mollisiaceae sp. DMI_Dod_QoI]|nr:hypothetical protein EG329_012325 [Helotiales sp. DMI_Dod_QoI]
MSNAPTTTFLPLLELQPPTKVETTHEPKQFIYIVIQATTSSNSTHVFKIRGSYDSLKDANKKVIALWEEEAMSKKGYGSRGVKSDGRFWWHIESTGKGDKMVVRIKKTELTLETEGSAKVWD